MAPRPPPRDKPITRAVALKYDGENIPSVVATGQHAVAEQIIARAQDADIPLVEDPALAQALSQLDLGDHIPPALFRAVAEVLSYALFVSGKHEEILRRANATRKATAPPGSAPPTEAPPKHDH